MLSGPFKRQPFFSWQVHGEKYDRGGRVDREDARKCVCA